LPEFAEVSGSLPEFARTGCFALERRPARVAGAWSMRAAATHYAMRGLGQAPAWGGGRADPAVRIALSAEVRA